VFLVDGVRVSAQVFSRRKEFLEHQAAEFECVEARRSGVKKLVRRRRRSRSMAGLVAIRNGEYPQKF
jgi:hypothetical protein